MGRKRQLSVENSDLGSPPPTPKLSKQSKLEDFFEPPREKPHISPITSAEVAANCPRTIDFSRLSPLTRSLIRDLIDVQDREVPYSRADKQDSELAEPPSQQFILISGALKQILHHLESIELLLKEHTANCLASHHQQCTLNSQIKPPKSPKQQVSPPQFENYTSFSPGKTASKLTLDPKSVALTVHHHLQYPPEWTRQWKAKKYLSIILNTDPAKIDLHRVELLPSLPRQTRVLLHFQSSLVPGLIFSHAHNLRGRGIFPLRHFKNLAIARLQRTKTDRPQQPVKRDSAASTNINEGSVSFQATAKTKSLPIPPDPSPKESRDVYPTSFFSTHPPPLPLLCGSLRNTIPGTNKPDEDVAQAIPAGESDSISTKECLLDTAWELPQEAPQNASTLVQDIDLLETVLLLTPSRTLSNGCVFKEPLPNIEISDPNN